MALIKTCYIKIDIKSSKKIKVLLLCFLVFLHFFLYICNWYIQERTMTLPVPSLRNLWVRILKC